MQRAFGVKSIFPTDPRFSTNDDSIGFESEPLIQCGRVDLAASRIGGIRQALGVSRDPGDPSSIMSHRPFDETDASVDYWGVRNTAVLDEDVLGEEAYQRDLIKSVVNWPRAERTPPGETRFDKHLTNHALGSACSSFIVEWTWDEGVGETDTVRIDPQTGRETDRTFRGLVIDPVDTWNGAEGSPILGQRWFGMYDSGRKVMPFGDVDSNNSQVEDALGWQNFCETFPLDGEPGSAPPSVLYSDPQGPRVNSNFNYIEDASYAASMGIDPSESVQEYWAIFGLNRKDALLSPDQSDMSDGYQDLDPSYTPWPTALRFTMTLHDPDTKLENGQQVQFIVKLPERCQ